MNEKTYNPTSLNRPCFVELKNYCKGIRGDTFQVQFCPDTFALICESSDMRLEQNGDTSVKLLKRMLELSEKSDVGSR